MAENRLYTTFEVHRPEDGGDLFRFVIAVNDQLPRGRAPNRKSERLRASDLKLDMYRRNPVVLYVHEFMDKLPVGVTETIGFEDGKLVADMRFVAKDDFADRVRNQVEQGALRGASVRWDDDMNMMEWSIAPVPVDPDAVRTVEESEAIIARAVSAMLSETSTQRSDNEGASMPDDEKKDEGAGNGGLPDNFAEQLTGAISTGFQQGVRAVLAEMKQTEDAEEVAAKTAPKGLTSDDFNQQFDERFGRRAALMEQVRPFMPAGTDLLGMTDEEILKRALGDYYEEGATAEAMQAQLALMGKMRSAGSQQFGGGAGSNPLNIPVSRSVNPLEQDERTRDHIAKRNVNGFNLEDPSQRALARMFNGNSFVSENPDVQDAFDKSRERLENAWKSEVKGSTEAARSK